MHFLLLSLYFLTCLLLLFCFFHLYHFRNCTFPTFSHLPTYISLSLYHYPSLSLFPSLLQMLYHLGKDHPYHSLYVILALSNAGLDNEFPQKGYVTGQRRSSTTTSTCGSAAGGGGGGKLRKSSVKGGSGVGGQCVVDDVRMMRNVWLLYCFCSRNWGCPGGGYTMPHTHTHTHTIYTVVYCCMM